jgi:hypothetical protein
VAIAALIHPWTYGRLCGLITYAAGGHGGWLSSDALLGSVTKSIDGLKGAWTDYAGDDPGIADSFSALVNILPLVGIWLVLVYSLLLAYIAGVLLSLSQAVILSILLAVGKTCITVTLVPGVGLGSSWARSLAKVAAWSTVAAILTALMVHAMPDLREMVRNMAYTAMLRTAGQFVVLAICTFAIPVITEAIFSGAAPAGNAALEAITKGWHGARTMGRIVSGSRGPADGAEGQGHSPNDGSQGGGRDRSYRPHKVSPSRLRQGLAAAGSLALAPIAVIDAVRRRQSRRRPEGEADTRISAATTSSTAAMRSAASTSAAPFTTRSSESASVKPRPHLAPASAEQPATARSVVPVAVGRPQVPSQPVTMNKGEC